MSTQTQPEQKPKRFFDPKTNLKALGRIVVIGVIVLGSIWLVIRFTAGKNAANTLTSKVLRQRVNVIDTIEDLPASSFKAVGLSLPYAGTLSIDITVRKGNEISVFVVRPDQIENIKAKQRFAHVQGFEAEKTKSYRRSGRLPSGNYHLVLMDKSLGFLSQSSSDIQITAKLDP